MKRAFGRWLGALTMSATVAIACGGTNNLSSFDGPTDASGGNTDGTTTPGDDDSGSGFKLDATPSTTVVTLGTIG